MRMGTKSLLFGAHCLAIHPVMLALAWRRQYGWPWDARLWACFLVHDLGYWGKTRIEGSAAEDHVVLGAGVVARLFGERWGEFCARHSRAWCKSHGIAISRLCIADKLAFVLTPAWLYLPMARWTDEIWEYVDVSRSNLGGYTKTERDAILSNDLRRWLWGLKSYTLSWIREQVAEGIGHSSTVGDRHQRHLRDAQ